MWKSYKINEVIQIENFYSLFHAEFKCNHTFPGEAHNFWECLYILKGEVCVSADNKVYNLGKNDIIFHKPMEFHKFTVTSKGGVEVLIFSFSMEGSLASYFGGKVFSLFDNQINILKNLHAYVESKAGSYKTEFEKYLPAFDSQLIYSQTVATYVCQLFLSLMDANSPCTASNKADAEDFAKAVDYMNSNICSNILISDIASHLNTSSSTVKRIFVKYAGISVHKYFMKLKIKTATELLNMGVSVSETANKLGFSSQGYFSGRYKKETGVTPGEVKKQRV